jgi:hypothetical protein
MLINREILISLSQKNRDNKFLKNKFELQCKCGYSEVLTYYEFLTGEEFKLGQPASVISPFISESIYEETITFTPLVHLKKCPVCGEEIGSIFPLSLENLITILQTPQPDPQMYG